MITDRKILHSDGVTEDELDACAIRLADVVQDSVVDGKGIRMTVFVQGCTHKCVGCHNPETWDTGGGKEYTLRFLADMAQSNPLLDGCTFSGGEPFLQASALAIFAQWLHENDLNVWCYSGFTLAQLLERAKTDPGTQALLSEIDVLVDGAFVENEKDLTLLFRGSKNQRVIDMVQTRAGDYEKICIVKGMES